MATARSSAVEVLRMGGGAEGEADLVRGWRARTRLEEPGWLTPHPVYEGAADSALDLFNDAPD